MNVGQKIKQLRLENNLTQEELAEQLGVSFQSVSRWENSTTYPDITMLPIIANMFDVTIDYLLDMDSYKKKDEIDKILKQVDILFNEGKTKEREVILENALKKYPNNFFDVGIAEGHAVSMAAGLASNGYHPVVAIYSTFLQRATKKYTL